MEIKDRLESCWDAQVFPKKGDLLVAVDGDEFDLTVGRVYVAATDAGDGTYHDCIFIVDDTGCLRDYTLEYLAPYDGRLTNIGKYYGWI